MNERSIDQYEILRELGRGGTSVVYLVKDKANGRNYAMKVLLKDDNKTDSYEQEADHLRARTENLRAEAEVLQALCTDEPGDVALHPGIPAYIECVCDGKGEFAGFVMEYVEGRSLQKILDDGRSFTVREAAVAGLQLCGIMEQLHGQDPPMIFRDLKPANILVRPDGKFVLVDYGAVRKLRKSAGSDTMRLGTDGYAAPEQYGGWEQSDERTDIYGIGAVLHHMVTGRPPLDTGLRPLGEILGAQGETLQYDGLAQILMRCCMTAPSMRYCSCKELEKALQKAPKDSPYLLEIYQELAFAYGDDGKIDEAMKTLNETDNLECDYNDLLVVRGHILLSNGFIEEGEAAFRKAIIGSKNAPLILLRVAVSIYDCHYLDSAYRLFKHLFDYVKEDFDQGYSYMALCCHSMKRYDEYLEYLKKAVSCNPDEAKATLSHLFPENISPEQYYEYAQKELKNEYNK